MSVIWSVKYARSNDLTFCVSRAAFSDSWWKRAGDHSNIIVEDPKCAVRMSLPASLQPYLIRVMTRAATGVDGSSGPDGPKRQAVRTATWY